MEKRWQVSAAHRRHIFSRVLVPGRASHPISEVAGKRTIRNELMKATTMSISISGQPQRSRGHSLLCPGVLSRLPVTFGNNLSAELAADTIHGVNFSIRKPSYRWPALRQKCAVSGEPATNGPSRSDTKQRYRCECRRGVLISLLVEIQRSWPSISQP